MSRDLSGKRQQNEFVEEKLLMYKKEYKKPQMSKEQMAADVLINLRK